MSAKPSPTRVNAAHLGGPVNHYDSITDAQARALGFSALPGKSLNATARVGEAVARRLSTGLLNVKIPQNSRLLRDPRFNSFMDSLSATASPPAQTMETMPVELDDVIRTSSPGTWVYEVATQRVSWSERSYEIYGCDPSQGIGIGSIFTLIHPSDRTRLETALNDAAYRGKELDETYRIVVAGDERHVRAKGRPYDVSATGAAQRVAGIVCLAPQAKPYRNSMMGRVIGAILATLVVAIPDAPLTSISNLLADDDEQQHVTVQVGSGSRLG